MPRRAQNRIAKERAILEAGLRVFSQGGYSGASMDAIAAAAGITKPTLYQYFDSKEELFIAIMGQHRDDMLTSFEQPTDQGMVQQLHAFAWAYAGTVMRPDFLSLARLIIGEAQRFPEIGRAYQASGPDRVLSGMMAYLEARRADGQLAFEDAELAAQDLWGLILSAPRNQALHMPDNLPDQAQLTRSINNGLRVFLKAYSTQPDADLSQLDGLKAPVPTGDS